MVRPDESDGQKQWQWRSRLAQGRLGLAAPVRASLAQEFPEEDFELEEEEDESATYGPAASPSESKAIISPRLSLQSRPMPVVRPDASSAPVKQGFTHSLPAEAQPGGTASQNTNALARIAQRITSSLGGIGSAFQSSRPGSPPVPEQPGMYNSSLTQPVTSPASTSHQTPASGTIHSENRLAGRTTKVRLKAVPKPEVIKTETLEPWDERTTGVEKSLPVGGETDPFLRPIAAARSSLWGSGAFESGQSDAAIANKHVTSASVVAVMLTAEPGPVVVQYVSLQPQVGFTLHLSAPAKAKTPFNYVLLTPEPF